MIKNYLKIAFRNLFKNKVYSFINIFGLAVGIACCLLIGLYVHNEWSYDEFHADSDRLYRAWVHEDYGNDEIYFNSVTPLILASALENNIPEVEQISRFTTFSNLVKHPDQTEAVSEAISIVDPDFFDMFDFEVIRGVASQTRDNPATVVITEQIAKQFFGEEDPLMQTLHIQFGDTFDEFTVAAIIKNPPLNSSIQFGILIPFSNSSKVFSQNSLTNWFSVSTETYVLLRENSRMEEINEKMETMMVTELGSRYGDDFNEGDLTYTVGLQPITDIRLNTEIPAGIAEVSDPVYSYILAAIALLVLLIACVNFMTLAISRSASRAREVGIRKTIGAVRQHLMLQFWGEALLMTMIALCGGVLLAELLLPRFNSLSGTGLQLELLSGNILILFGIGAILISFIAGIYPALMISGFKPVDVLKGRLSLSGDKNLFRQTMVIFQFSLSIALIAGTLIITQQLEYMRSADLGYNKDQVVVLSTDLNAGPGVPLSQTISDAERLKERLESELAGYPDITSISISSFTPVQSGGWISSDYRDQNDRKRFFDFNIVDHDFVETYGISLISGRDFSVNNPSDERRAILVNEALVEDYGWENPIGQRLPGPDFEEHEVIGVVQNFHYESLHMEVDPLALTINPDILFSGIENIGFSTSPTPRISVRFNSQNLPALMDRIEASWASASVGAPFNYTFVDQSVDNQYRQEERLSQIVLFGSALAIIIACLGLFGLASLMVVRRSKEIGVRKVLGASSQSIVLLINKEFTRLVLSAFIIAAPVAWFVMSNWLQNFAYRIEPDIGLFLLAGASALVIAWLTVGYQSIRATLINPTESLRSE
ncbi:ABC transporter permease [Rhodohalobacter mucosus]|uniref:Macrolide ABC transporter permease n=1 Tax=Rhodohalobacter mucosus TaxID=2079485 RepID=A0A316TTN7_9BACT|nr:ABC transporter permease [Rhodohalobacter mucosus]PWN07953.1 macrolide ABC transporter permease [Rhodohalobacter mucosus]